MSFRASLAGFIGLLALLLHNAAFAQDLDLSGYIDLGGRFLKENQRSARFLEYRDIDDGVFGSFRVDAAKDSYYMSLIGENVGLTKHHIGLDNQFFMLKGGRYDMFKYSLFYNETPHNLSFGARTFYSGVGTGNLSFTGAAPTPANFATRYNNTFDYKVNRRDYGASLELSLKTPFYLLVTVSENDKEGVQPMAGSTGSPGGGFVEFPMPVRFYTRNLTAEAGYRTNHVLFSVDGMISDFDNSIPYVTWTSPGLVGRANTTQTSSVAPDSNYWRIGGKLHLRLPLQAGLTLKGGYAKMENNLNLLTSIVNNNTGALVNLGNARNFRGDYTYTNVSADLNVHPVSTLDARLFYNFLNKGNDSSIITFTNGTTSENELFNYNKHDAGLEISARFPFSTKGTAGYEYLRVNRQPDLRADAVSSTDNSVFVQLKNSYFDFLTTRIKYRHLDRRSDFQNQNVGTGPTDAAYIRRFVRLFDAADKSQDMVKVSFEITPVEQLQIGIEYAFKINEYGKTTLGRTRDKRHEVYVDAEYSRPDTFKISAYFDYERVTSDSRHRNFVPGLSGDPNDPAATTAVPASGANTGNSAFNWNATLKDSNFAYGVGVEVPLLSNKLNLVAAWGYERASGKAEFAVQDNIISLVNIGNYDDYTKQAVNGKIVYRLNRNLDLSAGYAFEKFKYNDAALEGYTLVPAAGNFLTGAYADHDYEAHLWFVAATYRF